MDLIDVARPEILENRMIHPHYVSTNEKGKPFHLDADWGKQLSNQQADLVNPHGSMVTKEGQTFDLNAKQGFYDDQKKTLQLKEAVTLKSTDGYLVKTEAADITLDSHIIEGYTYVEGEGPAGAFMGSRGFKIEDDARDKKKKVITLKGPSRVVINATALKKEGRKSREK